MGILKSNIGKFNFFQKLKLKLKIRLFNNSTGNAGHLPVFPYIEAL